MDSYFIYAEKDPMNPELWTASAISTDDGGRACSPEYGKTSWEAIGRTLAILTELTGPTCITGALVDQGDADTSCWVIYGYEDPVFGEPLFWSNQHGWGSLGNATKFTTVEKNAFSLPIITIRGNLSPAAQWVRVAE